jgi:single-strand DNA-binding protein
MNKVILIGRLTRDAEIRRTQSDNPLLVASFSLAVDRRYKRDGQPDADFFNCSAFGKTAEVIEKYTSKGAKIAIEGSIQNDNYTDKNGVNHSTYRVIVDAIDFCETKASTQEKPKETSPDMGFINIPNEIEADLPFAQPTR